MSRTKIVATYGPACEDEKTIRGMLRAGVDVFRLNVSHLAPADLAATAERLRKIADAMGMPVAILADMPGPKIRCTRCEPESFFLAEGDRIEVAPGKAASTPERIHIDYKHLLDDVEKGHELAINDGMVLLRVMKVDRKAGALKCRVGRSGPVSSRKGVSFLQSTLRVGGLTARDREGLRAAAVSPIDFIALSFVRSADDLKAARRILKRADAPPIPLVSKIEQHEAIDHLDEIIEASEGLMVARGDMGIERPLEDVPLLQKDIIERSNRAGRFVITATQMLESMVENSRPTRAEVTDVANAILDGSDAVMLSAETATGRGPVQVVRTMVRIAIKAETRLDPEERLERFRPARRDGNDGVDLDDALAHAACRLGLSARLDALVCLSFHGSTARRISRFRPACDTFVLSPYEEQCRRLALIWGVEVYPLPEAKPGKDGSMVSPDTLVAPAIQTLLDKKRLKKGDRVAFLAGVPLDTPGGTNWMRVVEV